MLRSFALVVVAVAACGGGSADDADAGPVDLAPPAECALAAGDPAWQPAGAIGDEVGDYIADVALEDCDGNTLSLYEVVSQSEMTLFNIGAGWCEPCVVETQSLDAEVFREFCPRGLRVVQVMFQDEESRPATSLFCNQWRERHSLSFPVLKDPLFATMDYFESVTAQTPINFLIDGATGEILFKKTGAVPVALPDEIDDRLP